MDLLLAGKTAIVTGGSKGIGLAITQAFVDEGANVVVGAREPSEELTGLADRGGRVRPVLMDLTAPEAPTRLAEEAASAFGGADILVNNVGGVRYRPQGFLSITDEDWMWGLTVNFLVAVRTTRAVLPLLLDRGGSIVFVSSTNAFLPDPDIYDYTAGKAALSNFAKALSKEVGPQGVRVNTVSPGPTATTLWTRDDGIAASVSRARGDDRDAFLTQMSGRMVSNRFNRPEEIADLVLLLAGGRAGNVLGSNFVIDGGMIATL